jgi:hypothetical protein
VTGVVASVPGLNTPANNATGVAHVPSFNWTAAGSGLTQEIQVQPNGGGNSVWDYILPGTATLPVAYDTDGSASQSTLNAATTYQWNVRFTDANGNEADSQNFTFTTQ